MDYGNGPHHHGFHNGPRYNNNNGNMGIHGNHSMRPEDIITKRIFVGNLSFSTSWQRLKDHFKVKRN
jgi:hypothetical protein